MKFGKLKFVGKFSIVIVDARDQCHTVTFSIGDSTTTSRSWDITATQYKCNHLSEKGGPPGCLQYYTAVSDKIQSFNFPTGSTVGQTATHLSSQSYSICIRRNSGYCNICYSPVTEPTGTATGQASFGLGLSQSGTIADAVSALNTDCDGDYLEIPGGTTAAIAASSTALNSASSRICGRFFNTQGGQTANVSVCSEYLRNMPQSPMLCVRLLARQRRQNGRKESKQTFVYFSGRVTPFNVKFITDENELNVGGIAINADGNEQDLFPAGIIGFALYYIQRTC